MKQRLKAPRRNGNGKSSRVHTQKRESISSDLLNSMEAFAAILDSDGVVQFVTGAPPRELGYSTKDLIGKPFWDVAWFHHSNESQAAVRNTVGRAINGERSICDADVFTKDGIAVPITFDMRSLDGKAKNLVTVVAGTRSAMGQDGSDNTEAILVDVERMRQEIEKRYQAMYDNKLHLVYIHDEQGQFLDANECALNHLGYSREELGTVLFQDVVHPDDVPKVFAASAEVLAKGYMENKLQIRLIAKTGETFWIECHSFLLDQDDTHFRAIGIAQDITRFVNTEDEQRKSEENLRAILDNMEDTYFRIDMEGNMVMINPAGARLFGYESADEVVGKSLVEIVENPEELVETFMRIMVQACDGTLERREEITIIPKSGVPVAIEAAIRAVHDEAGNPVDIEALARDITERKQAEEELRLSEERLKDLVMKLKLSQEELSTPVIHIWDRILALPLIGVVDTHRSRSIMDILLTAIVETQSKFIIVDVTGVASMDTEVTNNLIRTIQSTRLLGAECVITGIKPEVAQTMVHLGVDLSKLVIKSDMEDGLKYGLRNMGYDIKR